MREGLALGFAAGVVFVAGGALAFYLARRAALIESAARIAGETAARESVRAGVPRVGGIADRIGALTTEVLTRTLEEQLPDLPGRRSQLRA